MALVTRTILILALTLAIAGRVSAQETTAQETAETSTTTTITTETTEQAPADAAEKPAPAATTRTSYETLNRFTSLLRDHHPPDVATILKLDPSLLSNDAFIGGYPELKEFLDRNPEIRRNPRFYLSEFAYPGRNNSALDDIVEMILVASGFSLAAFGFAWLVRTIIEQKRWNRLSRTQTEVHNKILDRFGSSEELLQYIKTDAGSKFLESAPIPLHADRRPAQNTPAARILWSIQLGVVIAVASLGMLLVGLGFDGETAQGLFAIGAITFTVGAGFIASAFVSMSVSRRLGLWQGPDAQPPIDDSVTMR